MKNKNQLDVIYYFIVLLIGSTCFGHYFAHHQELATIMLITTLNYQSTNETHYTQENTTITTHKGSQLLKLTETRYQLQPSDKELHIYINATRSIFTEWYDVCGNRHYSRELLMMSIVMPETCWASKKYNKIISGI